MEKEFGGTRRGWHASVSLCLWAAIAGLAVAAALPEFGRLWWWADLLSHFRHHILVASGLILLAALAMRRPVASLVIAVLCLPHIFAILHPGRIHADPVVLARGEGLRVVTINLQWNNRTPERAIAFIRGSGADLVLVQEATRRWHDRIAKLSTIYPYIAPKNWRQKPQNILLSKHPITRARIRLVTHLHSNFLDATVSVRSKRVRVIGIHPPYPLRASLAERHRRQFALLRTLLKTETGPIILAGDFNLTPYSVRFQDFLIATRLRRADRRTLWPVTWPTVSPIIVPRWMIGGLPIDHILLSQHFRLHQVSTGPRTGSDHLPLIADISFAAVETK